MILNWFHKIKTAFYRRKTTGHKSPPLAHDLSCARREWICAQNYYDNVLNEDLVDHAAYTLKAAEKKYAYLFKLAKQEGVRHNPFSY